MQHGWEGKGNHCEGGNSPDLVPSNFHLLLRLKKHLASQKFHKDKEVKNEVTIRLRVQVVDFYDIGVQKLVPRLNKCLDNGGDYVKKYVELMC